AQVTVGLVAVEELLPSGQRVRFTEHESTNDQRLDVRKVSEHPECVAAALWCGEDHTVLPHLVDAREHAVCALLQVVAYEIDRLHVVPAGLMPAAHAGFRWCRARKLPPR